MNSVIGIRVLAVKALPFSSAESSEQAIRKVAIFVENRAGNAFNDKVSVLDDLITSRVTEKIEQEASAFNRELLINAINALKSYSTPEAKASGETNISDAKSSGTKTDQRLSNDTSALRLAQTMGADYIIITSLTSFGVVKKTQHSLIC